MFKLNFVQIQKNIQISNLFIFWIFQIQILFNSEICSNSEIIQISKSFKIQIFWIQNLFKFINEII
jgi:hypothetical protein